MSETFPWDETLRLMAYRRIRGVLDVAVRDASQPDAAAVLLGEIHLELDEGYLRMQSVNNHGGLKVGYLDAIDLQEYEEAFLVRLDSLFLGESQEVECLQINYVTNEESDLEQGIVLNAEFVFSHGHRVFFDPMYTNGVRVGNTDYWTQSWDHGPWTFQQFTWTRP